jgi:ATP-dependent protease ClpP protease subunit
MSNLVPIVLEHTSKGERSYDIRDTFMTAEQSVAYGLADKMITKREA